MWCARVNEWNLETVAKNGGCLFLICRPFVALEIIQNNLKLLADNHTRENTKRTYGKHGINGSNVEIIAISEIY
jgi:hypothetical protein